MRSAPPLPHAPRAPYAPHAPRALAALLALSLCALALVACGDTIQDQPLARSSLEPLISAKRYPVYWLGGRFHRLSITEATHDPGGAYTLHYGDCAVGGQYTCVTPLSIVTSPDNSFVPGAGTQHGRIAIRGVGVVVGGGGQALELATGAVVVDVYSEDPKLALAAARAMTPINRLGLPGAPLAQPLPDTGFASTPLAVQMPPGARSTSG
jgi:hypothetical protein